MKNVTISVDNSLLKASRECAHRRNTSLNQLIRDLLATVATNRSTHWIEECFTLMDKFPVSRRGKKWRREDLYDR